MWKPSEGIINQSIIITTLFYKIPPHLPFPKGGTIPLFGKEGLGEIFRRICLLYYGLINKLRYGIVTLNF